MTIKTLKIKSLYLGKSLFMDHRCISFFSGIFIGANDEAHITIASHQFKAQIVIEAGQDRAWCNIFNEKLYHINAIIDSKYYSCQKDLE